MMRKPLLMASRRSPGYFRFSHDHRRVIAYLDGAAALGDFVIRLFDITHNRPP